MHTEIKSLSELSQRLDHLVFNILVDIYFEVKRKWYQLRYPNLTLVKGVKLKGSLKISGSVKVKIDSGSRIRKRVKIFGSGEVTVGKNVSLNGSLIGCQKAVSINDDCLISNCYLLDTDYHNLEPHLRHAPPGPKVTAPIVIERNVWIGANATVMKGVCVGENSVIGLGSVVRKSIPPNVVVIGNPQQIVKSLLPESQSIISCS
ncbi:MAG: acyltransferase [Xenococcaceae cyanobacterium MO_167.B27]|nr:acyltransferase [Xenococcaceae cyanobacterium MO_167.B27]